MIFTLGELFCGPGGLGWGATHADIGLKDWKINHLWANDYDADTCSTYRANICPERPRSVIHKDVRKLDFATLKPPDAMAFGFPCNDFSVVGEQKGMDGVFGPLYSFAVRAIDTFRPQWFVAENVAGLRNANDGEAFSIITRAFSKAGPGYVLTPHLYKFEEYGIPQMRHRIIIVGIRSDLGRVFKIPSPSPYKDADISARHALEVPPIPASAPNSELMRQSPIVIERLKHIKPGENAFTADLPQNLKLNIAGAKISQIYRRLDPDKPSYTVTGSGGGGTYLYHWSENRALTNRERARLQTFPDDFVFFGGPQSVRRQIGMAVPCQAAKIVFEAILKTFAGIDYDSVRANLIE